MDLLDIAEKFNALIYRRRYGNGFRPHFSIRIDGVDFHIDSSPGKGFNIITHAHSDHHGMRNVRNLMAIASEETAKILSAISEERFRGQVHRVGERLDIKGIKIDTYPTGHIDGASAYFFRDFGILVTGDVKYYHTLPQCDVLITEATYGHPSYTFEDEVDRVIDAAEKGHELGAYPVGKAQRVARILSENGIGFHVSGRIKRICDVLGIEHESGEARIVSPKEVSDGFVLSAQRFYRRRIVFSDHVDYRGIVNLVEHCSPEYVLFYHGNPTEKLIDDVRERGVRALTLKDIRVHL